MILDDFLAELPPLALRNTHYAALALAVSLVGLAAVLKVDMVVSGTGRLAADTPTIVLQPMQLSIVREIRVKPGDAVHAGDVLVALDPTFAQADQAALRSQRDGVVLRRSRLEAELAGLSFDPGSDTAVRRLEATLFRQRSAQYEARLAEFEGRLATAQADIAASEWNQDSLVQQLAVARELEAMRASLFQSHSGSKLAFLEASAGRMRNERDLRAAAMTLSDARQRARSLEAERQAFADSWRRELLEGLGKAEADLAAAEEALTKAVRLAELVVLRAPVDAVVLDVAKRSAGSVAREAEPLVTLVPAGAALIAEVSVPSADIGYVRAGDQSVVKVDAFPFQRHGTLSGRLRSMAEDSFGDGPVRYHRGQVALDGAPLSGLPEGARLIPGMTVTAEIAVGRRSVLSYLFDPITRALRESMREP